MEAIISPMKIDIAILATKMKTNIFQELAYDIRTVLGFFMH